MILVAGAVLAACLIVWILRNQTVWVLGLIVALYVAIPSQADGVVVPLMHPGSYLTVALTLQHLVVRDRGELWSLFRPALRITVGFLLVMSLGFLDLLNPFESDPVWVVSTIGRIFVIPFLLFPLTLMEIRRRPSSRRTLSVILIGIGLVQVVIALVQYNSDMQSWVWWRSYYELSYWWTDTFPIPLGTMGHPLQLAAYLAMCIPLLARMKSPILAVALGSLFLYGCALATGRASTALAAIGLVFLLVWHGRRWFAAAFATSLAAVIGVQLWRSDGFQGLREKVVNDQGSAQLRQQALEWAFDNLGDYIWFGYPGGHDLRGNGILRSSLENGYLIAGLAFGLLFAGAVLLVHVVTMVRPLGRGTVAVPEVLATSFVWVGFFASSSFMAFAIDGRTFWLMAGVAWAVALPRGSAPAAAVGEPGESLLHVSEPASSSVVTTAR